ncbi:hypothetical protein RN001_005562 [Aquatica leii]|uniref:Regulatory protein zeste n=1 Tax=Aquatica leii TaxID=1421715 RepID=A0AAN7QKE6_9COLE|nr:hypothetical protein RN001_005562 [Aquatica leii]
MNRMDNDLTAVMTEPPQKLCRAANFTNRKKSHLFNIIANKYAKTVEDKKTDRTSIADKTNAWINIEKDFNSTSPHNILRTAESLRKFYENKKKELVDYHFFVDSDSDGNLPVPQYEPEDIILEVNEHDGIEDGSVILTQENNYELATTSSDCATWKMYTRANLQDPVHPSLRSATVNIESNYGVNNVNVTPKADLSKNASRRRPTTSLRTFTSSDVAKQYYILLDRRLMLVDKQIKQIDEEREFKKENHNVTMELLNWK